MALRFWMLLALLSLSACTDSLNGDVKVDWESMADPAVRDWPDKLSAWNLLHIDDGFLKPSISAEPYQLNTPLFSDYADKFRTIWLPKEAQLTQREDGSLGFPVGAVLSKTFYYSLGGEAASGRLSVAQNTPVSSGSVPIAGNRLIETRLLINTAYGWVGLPYIWNEQQDEAVLEIAGGGVPIRMTLAGGEVADFSYSVPNVLECASCHAPNHSAKKLLPLGPTLGNLNLRKSNFGDNQIQRFVAKGWLAADADVGEPIARWDDEAESLEQRAKAYLQVNCAHCHNQVGAADTSGLYLNYENQVDRSYGICKPPVAAGKGSGGLLVGISPGASEKSILSYRLHSTDPGAMMPEIGRTIVHREGVELVDKWIDQLSGGCE